MYWSNSIRRLWYRLHRNTRTKGDRALSSQPSLPGVCGDSVGSEKEQPPRIKPLLDVYRGLLTGLHLMRTGRIEANLIALNDEFRLPCIPELVARKIHGAEKGTLESGETEFHRREYERLVAQLEAEVASTHLPEEAICRDALDDLLVRVRLRSVETGRSIISTLTRV